MTFQLTNVSEFVVIQCMRYSLTGFPGKAKFMRQYVGRIIGVLCLAVTFAVVSPSQAQLPQENVVDVPAISDGLCLHNLFQSNMVLQRDKEITIRGWAEPGEKITVYLHDLENETTAKQDRSWNVSFPSMPASSDPISIRVVGSGRSIILENVLIGDVWILGGQSNMEFPLSRIENGQLEIVSANYPQIRILTVPYQDGPEKKESFPRLHEWSGWFGTHYRKGDWDVCSPEVVRELSAIGYTFARRVHMASQVPIGVIDVSRGGTTVETWTPDSTLRSIDTQPVKELMSDWDQRVAAWDSKEDLAQRIQNHRDWLKRMEREGRELTAEQRKEPSDLRPGPALDTNRPGNCFASMIAPIEGLQAKGVIFHQGYNNCFNGTPGAKMYRDVFPKMIQAWRKAFSDPEMPFGIISLCTEGQPQTLDNFTEMMANAGPYIREAQYLTFLDSYKNGDKNIGFTSSYDLRRRWYHPQLKIPAGERMARWALATQYGFEREIRWKPPILLEMEVKDGNLALRFDEALDAVDDGGPMQGFAIAGEDRKFHPAVATHLVVGQDERGRPMTDNKSIVLTSTMVSNPVHFRYAWARSPLANVQAQPHTDIPLPTQRSDEWPLEGIPFELFGDDVPKQLSRPQRRQQTEALQLLDLERRKSEARLLLK